jgi:hypothetical protein
MLELHNAASADSLNLNSGCFGFAQGMFKLKTISIMSIRLFGQSKDVCRIMLQMSFSNGYWELQGKYEYSPSNSVICVSLKLMLLLNVLFLLLIAEQAEGQC